METKIELFREIIEQSQTERRGLTVYFHGQSVVGIVTKINGEESIEMSSQMFRRIIVRLDAVEAMAIA